TTRSALRMRAWQSVWRGAFVALFLITTVTACSVPVAPAQHSAQGVFERVGRFAINVEGPEGQRDAVQGSFSWKDDGQRLRLELFDPLGATQARVEVTDNLAWVQHADGREEYAAHADALMAQVVGSPIPVAGLRDWLEGHTGARPSSDLDVDEIDRP